MPLKPSDYKKRLAQVEKIFNIKIDKRRGKFTAAEKATITKHYNLITKYSLQKANVYKGSRKNKIMMTHAFAPDIPRNSIKFGLVPHTVTGDVSIKTIKTKDGKKKKVVFENRPAFKNIYVPFDHDNLIDDAETEIEKVLSDYDFDFGNFHVFQHIMGEAFTEEESAVELWYEYEARYPSDKPQCAHGCVLTTRKKLSKAKYESLTTIRAKKKLELEYLKDRSKKKELEKSKKRLSTKQKAKKNIRRRDRGKK